MSLIVVFNNAPRWGGHTLNALGGTYLIEHRMGEGTI